MEIKNVTDFLMILNHADGQFESFAQRETNTLRKDQLGQT